MESYFNIEKKLGFGCMRLPMRDKEIDTEVFSAMVDAYLKAGFNYFDTAHGYHNGQSEVALAKCLTSRHPRGSYILTNKLSSPHFQKEEDIRPLFQSQLEICGVEYFDFYLMHAQDSQNFKKYKACRAYETALQLQAEGKFRHFGISFHDKAAVLDQILTEYPQVEVVQIQLNYMDYEDASVEARKVYEVCRRHGKPVIVMEPVKGGCLAKLPPDAQAVFDALGGASAASYAIRFAAGFDGIMTVLSGMSDMDMLLDNMGYMQDFRPLSDTERAAVDKVCAILKAQDTIPCTACRYCTEGCPANIPIPDLFACLNEIRTFRNWIPRYYYGVHTHNAGKAGDCLRCGLCEDICPQHLPIRDLLSDVSQEFDKKN